MYCKQIFRRRKQEWAKARRTHVKNGDEEPVEKQDGEANVSRSPPRDRKRGARVADLTPVEGENAHGQAVGDAKQLVDHGIFWSHPTNP